MELHLFNGSDPVLLKIEDTRYKPLISLRQGIMVIEAELSEADKNTLATFFYQHLPHDLADLQRERDDLLDEIDDLTDKAEELSDEVYEANRELRAIEKEKEELELEREDLLQEINNLKKNV